MKELIEAAIKSLAEAFYSHPLDFVKERDVVCFLHKALLGDSKEEKRTRVSHSIPDISDSQTVLVHAEVPLGDERCDLVVLNEGSSYQLLTDKDGRVRGFEPDPSCRFLAGLEIKWADTKSGRSLTSPTQGLPEDLKKLGKWLQDGKIEHAYAVVVDFYKGRDVKDKLQGYANGHEGVVLAYISRGNESVRWFRDE